MHPRHLLRLARLASGAFLLATPAMAQSPTAQTFAEAAASFNKLGTAGTFEVTDGPSYWAPSGTGATYARSTGRAGSNALQLSGTGASAWTMGEAVRNWTDFIGVHGSNGFTPGEIKINAYAKATGVNTNPTSDAGKFQMVVDFKRADGSNIFGQSVVIDLPQVSATYDWVKIDNSAIGALTLPEAARSVSISFRKGATATGTMMLDDLYVEGVGGWPGTIHNGNMEAVGGWYYYTPDAEAGFPTGQSFRNGVVCEASATHSGMCGLVIQDVAAATGTEAVHISPRVGVTPNKPVLVSFWVKTSGNVDPSTIGTGDNNIGLTALWYTNLTGGKDGYGEVGGLDIRLNGEYNPMVIPLLPKQADNGWTQYAFVVTPPVRGASEAPVNGMELRLRYWHSFSGAAAWDDVVIADVADVTTALPNLVTNGDFETMRPAYWEATGTGAQWSSQARSLPRSLALTGSGEASWTMGEAVRNWTDFIGVHGSNGFTPGEIKIAGYVRADGVNTNPTTDAGKFQLVADFKRADGSNIFGQSLVIDLPQGVATTSGWIAFDNLGAGAIVLPEAATSVSLRFRKGAATTGTMYLDDLRFEAAGGWPGTLHNGNVDAGNGWYYYTPDAEGGFPAGQTWIAGPTTAAAHSGALGLQIQRLGAAQGEAVHISSRVPASKGNPVLLSFWARTAGNADPSTIGTGDNNIGLTGLWYKNLTGGKDGYGDVGGFDVRFNGEYNDRVIPRLAQTADTDWRHYAVVAYAPEKPANETVVGMELRLRYWHSFTGQAHFDDVSIVNLGGTALSTSAEAPPMPPATRGRTMLRAPYPNPLGAGTATLAFTLTDASAVTLDVYDLLGRRVASVVSDETLAAGEHRYAVDSRDLPSGTYVVRLRAAGRAETQMLTVAR